MSTRLHAAGLVIAAALLAPCAAVAQAPGQGFPPGPGAPPGAVPPGAMSPGSSSPVCIRLETQLASIDRGGGDNLVPRLQDALAKQRTELDRTVAYARSLNCGGGIFLFGPTPAPQCGDLNRRISAMRANMDKLSAQLVQAQGGANRDGARRQILAALAQNNCGPQYRTAAVAQPPRQTGFFGMLFGGGGAGEEEPGAPAAPAEEAPRVSTWRTVCARTCDGFFFPVSYATVPSAFGRDEAICKMTCPGTEARLFAYPNPGGDMDQAVSPHGDTYKAMPNAFRYRTEFVPGCSCKPEGMSWAEALAGVDATVRKGDIVVDEARSEALSRPRGEARPETRRPEQPVVSEPEASPRLRQGAPVPAPAQ